MANFSEEAWMDPAKNTIALNRRMSGRPVDPVILVGPDGEPYHAGDVSVTGDVNFDKTGLATETQQQLSLTQLTAIAAAIANQATAARQDTGNSHLNTISSGITAINTELADHATRANQTAIIAAINALGSNNLADISTATLQQAANVLLGNIQSAVDDLVVTANGAEIATVTPFTTATLASSTLLATSSQTRLEAVLYNDTDRNILIALGNSASTASFSVRLLPQETFIVENYHGTIQGIVESSGGTGNLRVTLTTTTN